MVSKKYMRLFWASIVTGAVFIVLLCIYYLMTNDLEGTLIYFITLVVAEIFTGGLALYFASITRKNDSGLHGLDYTEIQHIIMKNDVWFFKRLLIFDQKGKYIGRATMKLETIGDLIVSLLSHFGIIVPVDYYLRDHTGSVISIFRRRGFRSALVDIYDGNREPLGHVEFDELKIILKFKGKVFVGEKAFPVATEFFFEDADADGILMLSSFSNAIEYHNIFRNMNTEVAKLEETIDTDIGKVALTLMAILYYVRWNSN